MVERHFESYPDRKIREAIERGDFDHNPLAGKPLGMGRPGVWRPWIVSRLEREDLSGVMPAPLQVRREKQRILDTLAPIREESDAREIVEDLNRRIKESNLDTTGHLRVITAPLDVEAVLIQWHRVREGGDSATQ